MDDLLHNSMKTIAKNHKLAIVQELNKRQDRMKEQLKKQKEQEEAKRLRKEKRAALREKHRLGQLKDIIQAEVMKQAILEEFNTKLKIYDIKDPASTNDGIIIIGGLLGELIITFTCLLDFILATPSNENFQFTSETVEAYLTDLLCADDSHF